MNVLTVETDTPHGRGTYSEWRPAHLAGVERIFHFEGPTAHPRKRIFPNGSVELLVNLGAPYRVVAGAGPEHLETVWLGGTQSGPLVVEQPAYQSVLGVRLHATGAYALFGRPMREVHDLTVHLTDLVGGEADELHARCHEAVSVDARFRVLAAWLAKRLGQARGANEPIAWAAARIDRSDGAVAVAELRRQTGLSKARLAAAFREQVGMAPKLYARVVRFRRLLALLQQGSAPLVEVALAAGYYDQPHMNSDFRELAGLTPGEFLAARYPVGDGSTAIDVR
jgi:AraC-like DNA-binding protein